MKTMINEMNPRVQLHISHMSIEDVTEETVCGYNVVCYSGINFGHATRINNAVRDQNIGYYGVCQHALSSWIFCDVGDSFDYIVYIFVYIKDVLK